MRRLVALLLLAALISVVTPFGFTDAQAQGGPARYRASVFNEIEGTSYDFDPSNPSTKWGWLKVWTPVGDPLAVDGQATTCRWGQAQSAECRPVIVLVHGGGFWSGDRDSLMHEGELGMELVRRGFVVVTVEYRVTWWDFEGNLPCDPDVGAQTLPCIGTYTTAKEKAVEDVLKAVRFLRDGTTTVNGQSVLVSDALNLSPTNIVLAGHSAGAIAALEANYRYGVGSPIPDDNDPNTDDAALRRTKGVVSLAGMMDDQYQHAGAPPALLIHGPQDGLLSQDEDREIAIKAATEGNPVELHSLCQGGHNPPTHDALLEISNFAYDQMDLGGQGAPPIVHEKVWRAAGTDPNKSALSQHVVGSFRSYSTSGVYAKTSDGYYPNNRNLVSDQASFPYASFESTPPAGFDLLSREVDHGSGWEPSAQNEATLATSALVSTDGYSILLVRDVAWNVPFRLHWQPISVEGGRRYYVNASATRRTVARPLTLTVSWFDEGGSPVGAEASVTELAVPVSPFMERVDQYVTAPPLAETARITATWGAGASAPAQGAAPEFQGIDDIVFQPDISLDEVPMSGDASTRSMRIVGNFNGDVQNNHDVDDVLVVGPTPNQPATAGVREGCDTLAYGQGSGVFRSGELNVPFDGRTPLVGDFNGDQKDDVYWFHPSEADALWLGRAGPDATPSCQENDLGYPWSQDNACYFDIVSQPPDMNGTGRAPAVGRFNGDSIDDLFWYGSGSESEAIWYGGSNGQFTVESNPPAVSPTGLRPLVGDFDDNGRDDIVFWPSANALVPVLRFPVSGAPTIKNWDGKELTDPTAVKVAGNKRQAVVGDFDGDHIEDLFQPSADSTVLDDRMWRGKSGATTFAVTTSSRIDATAVVAVGDVNGDGRDDAIYSLGGGATTKVRLGRSAATDAVYPFESPSTLTTSSAGESVPLIGDFDGDGKSDLWW